MKSEIQIFKHEIFGEIRTVTNQKGETFFVGKDVAKALGYSKPQNAIATHVDEEDKSTAPIQGTAYETRAVVINESGLYSLILSSKLEQAKAFKRLVTSEVLPQIRMTGGYIPTHDAEGRQFCAERGLSDGYAGGSNVGHGRDVVQQPAYEHGHSAPKEPPLATLRRTAGQGADRGAPLLLLQSEGQTTHYALHGVDSERSGFPQHGGEENAKRVYR